jgi:hypothetical protein
MRIVVHGITQSDMHELADMLEGKVKTFFFVVIG